VGWLWLRSKPRLGGGCVDRAVVHFVTHSHPELRPVQPWVGGQERRTPALWAIIHYMPRFVLLLHETPAGYPRGTHFDLMLEHDAVLRTWAMDRWPAAGESVLAEKLPDHRLAYLDYEGEVAGDRGSVSRVLAGEFDVVTDAEALLVIALRSPGLTGNLTLTQTTDAPHRWRVSLAVGAASSSSG